MALFVENRRTSKLTLLARYDNPIIIDTTSQGIMPYRKLSPFYPHGNIPIPFSLGEYACSVEGIWQGLKVFREAGIDKSKFCVKNMKGLKRTQKACGEILGHQRGVNDSEILDYITAKRLLYIPSYLWVIENCLQKEMDSLIHLASDSVVVLLDY